MTNKKKDWLIFRREMPLNEYRLTKKEVDVLWQCYSTSSYTLWDDGFCISRTSDRHDGRIPIRLKNDDGGIKEAFVLERGRMYTDADLSSVNQIFHSALRQFLKRFCAYKNT